MMSQTEQFFNVMSCRYSAMSDYEFWGHWRWNSNACKQCTLHDQQMYYLVGVYFYKRYWSVIKVHFRLLNPWSSIDYFNKTNSNISSTTILWQNKHSAACKLNLSMHNRRYYFTSRNFYTLYQDMNSKC